MGNLEKKENMPFRWKNSNIWKTGEEPGKETEQKQIERQEEHSDSVVFCEPGTRIFHNEGVIT